MELFSLLTDQEKEQNLKSAAIISGFIFMHVTDVSLLITISNNNFWGFKMCWPTAAKEFHGAWCPQETPTSMTTSNTSSILLITGAIVCILINSHVSGLLDVHLLDMLT